MSERRGARRKKLALGDLAHRGREFGGKKAVALHLDMLDGGGVQASERLAIEPSRHQLPHQPKGGISSDKDSPGRGSNTGPQMQREKRPRMGEFCPCVRRERTYLAR